MNARRQLLTLVFLGSTALAVHAQLIYSPSGVIGSSTTANLGVGTASPSHTLTVAGNISLQTGSTANAVNPEIGNGHLILPYGGTVRVTNDVNNASVPLLAYGTFQSRANALKIGQSSWPSRIIFSTGDLYTTVPGGDRAVIDHQGNFGLGVINPAARIDISGLTDTTGLAIQAKNQSGAQRFAVGDNGDVQASGRLHVGNGIDLGAVVGGVGGNRSIYRVASLQNDSPLGIVMEAISGGLQFKAAYSSFLDQNGNQLVGLGRFQNETTFDVWASSGESGLRVAPGDNGDLVLMSLGDGGSYFRFKHYGADANVYETLTIAPSGNVGIGTSTPTHRLSVNGSIRAKEVIVETTGWSDYVFADDYRLAPLSEVESHIKANKHLPGIPSAAEVSEKGVGVGEMQAKLLAKVEELTLHVIAQEKRIKELESQVQQSQAR